VTRGTVTAMWHYVSLTRGKNIIFLKILKKLIKNKKNSKNKNKKIQKIQKLIRGTPFNTVTPPLTERT